jgi:hypothetical protein
MINLSKHKTDAAPNEVSIIPMPQPVPEPKPKAAYDKQSKAFFLTINNPEEHGCSHEQIIDIMHRKFKNIIYWCMCDEQGTTYHTHIYILLLAKKRWSAVQRAFPSAHIESEVKGSPQECRAYIRKEGSKYAAKAETNFPETFYEEGSLPDFFISADKTEMLQQIENLLDSGLRPEQIMSKSIVFRQYESLIRKQFFAKRFAETPPIRDVKVIWHLGLAGSGKSYTYVRLCEDYGADNVYYASDFTNGCSAMLDSYEAQPYLFIDEVKTDSFKYGYLLQLLQGYRTPVHARYSNVYSLWKELHVTSIFTPREVYDEMVGVGQRATDSFYQLARRITTYVYHWKTDDGVYHTYEIPAKEFVSYDDIKRRAEGIDGFEPLTDSEMPFDD